MVLHLSVFKQEFPKDTSFEINGNVYKRFNGSLWLKLFYHSIQNNIYWKNNDPDIWNCDELDKYSRLAFLNSTKFKKGYEFLLEYPEIDGYNHWYQRNNPTTFYSTEKVPEYREIHISWDYCHFGGLALLYPGWSNAFLRGSQIIDPNCMWYYAIGQSDMTWGTPIGIAGPELGHGMKYVNLWINVNTSHEFSKKAMPQIRLLRMLFFFFLI